MYQSGGTVGLWTLLEYRPGSKRPRADPVWRCRCSCGVERWVRSSNIALGKSRSCGHDLGKQHAAFMQTVFPREEAAAA